MKKRIAHQDQLLDTQHPQTQVAALKTRSSEIVQKLKEHPGIIAIVLTLLVTYLFSSLLSAVRVVDLSAGSWALFG